MIAVYPKLKAPIFSSEFTGISRGFREGTMDWLNLRFFSRSAHKSKSDKPDTIGWGGWFKEKSKKGEKVEVEVESVRGGEDLWSAATEDCGVFPEHLVVMVHGLVGSAEDWRFAAEQFVKKIPTKVIVHRSECNSSILTFDGVDLMGERLADEVMSVVNSRRGIQKISFVAHSLGGLIARYAIGRLYESVGGVESSLHVGNHSDKGKTREGRIAGLEPMNFITFATPHLGSRGNKQLPLLCGVPFLEQRASKTAHFIVGRTGKHLFLTDDDDGKPPLLLRMADDCDDIKFISALGSFRRCVAYANANFDHMVGWRTSSIRRQHELPKYHLLVSNEKYPHIVFVDKGHTENARSEESFTVEAQNYDLEGEELLVELRWCRCGLSYDR
ncbi:hypothetical protein J5N97_003357 [Dioscorea zingiberensis]|uniref:DUF676 domain-containing protein n=1 Tax=Dioscorea zingiberensis TaxID=325984 RepID=A0A9D5D4I7_9LILI|nr:hypothetical protein J5N97_003357 [Dioscorea zingiberensis]